MENRLPFLEELRDALAKTGRRIQKPLPLQLFGEQIQFVDDARYLGVSLEK
jgi:hypothetical protein